MRVDLLGFERKKVDCSDPPSAPKPDACPLRRADRPRRLPFPLRLGCEPTSRSRRPTSDRQVVSRGRWSSRSAGPSLPIGEARTARRRAVRRRAVRVGRRATPRRRIGRRATGRSARASLYLRPHVGRRESPDVRSRSARLRASRGPNYLSADAFLAVPLVELRVGLVGGLRTHRPTACSGLPP